MFILSGFALQRDKSKFEGLLQSAGEIMLSKSDVNYYLTLAHDFESPFHTAQFNESTFLGRPIVD